VAAFTVAAHPGRDSPALRRKLFMSKQLILGSVLGGIVLFVWGAIAWMIIPWPGQPLRAFKNDDAVTQAIVANAPRSGNYLLPNPDQKGLTAEQQQKAQDRMARGPIVFAAVRLEPFNSMAKPLISQFLTQLLVALLGTILLSQTSGLSYQSRVVFLTTVGVVIFVGGHFDEATWWSFSSAYMFMQFGAIVIGWFLASLIMAKFVTGNPAHVRA
jgi:hypothetical protein